MLDYQYELEEFKKREGKRRDTKEDIDLIVSLIKKHKSQADEMRQTHGRYRIDPDCIPIFDRELQDPTLVDNVINNDFVSEIIDAKIGYFAGTPVTYTPEQNDEFIQRFSERNRLADLDAEITKYASLCGYGVRHQYVDTKGEYRIINVKPWEVILLGEDGIDETDYAVRYYEVAVKDGAKEKRVELHEPFRITEYRSGKNGEYEFFEERVITYGLCPTWGYENNEEQKSDVKGVLKDIDAYDRTKSDVNSEIEAHRSAILALYGMDAPREGEKDTSFARPGTMYLREGQKAEFVVKVIQDTAVENHQDRITKDIYRFSKTPNLDDTAFGGTVTGVGAQYKLSPLENKTATFERKHRSSSIRMFEILGSAVSIKNIKIDPYKIDMKYTRTFPKDILDAAKTQTELKGNVSTRTRLAYLPGLTDVEAEALALEEEEDAYMEKMMEQEIALGGGTDDGQGTGSAGKGKKTS